MAEKRELEILDGLRLLLCHEAKGPRLFCYFYLLGALMIVHTRSVIMDISTILSVLSSIAYVACILIILYYRRRDFFNTDRLKKSCLYMGITIEIWILQVLLFDCGYPFILVIILCVFYPE